MSSEPSGEAFVWIGLPGGPRRAHRSSQQEGAADRALRPDPGHHRAPQHRVRADDARSQRACRQTCQLCRPGPDRESPAGCWDSFPTQPQSSPSGDAQASTTRSAPRTCSDSTCTTCSATENTKPLLPPPSSTTIRTSSRQPRGRALRAPPESPLPVARERRLRRRGGSVLELLFTTLELLFTTLDPLFAGAGSTVRSESPLRRWPP